MSIAFTAIYDNNWLATLMGIGKCLQPKEAVPCEKRTGSLAPQS